MLVVGVTVIVVVLALSAFRTYSARGEIAATVAAMERVRRTVEQSFRRTGTPPATLAELGAPLPGRPDLLESVRVENGRVELTFSHSADPALAGQSLYLTPFETVNREIVWICGNRLPGLGLKPLGFAGGTNLAEPMATRIEPRFLPEMCR